MLRNSAISTAALVTILFVACGESDQQSSASKLERDGSVDAPGAGGGESGGSTGTGGRATGGRSVSGAGGASQAGGGSAARAGGGASAQADASPPSDAATNDGSRNTDSQPPPPRCMASGPRSWCTSNSDCCQNSCILNQCTCVPLGYSCTGPGQCCSGYACQNGTCICPPDIRGC